MQEIILLESWRHYCGMLI